MNAKHWKIRLKKGFNKLRDVLTGKTQITNRLKFHALIGSIASVHVLLLVIFSVFQIMPLFYFNIFSVLTYVVCFWLMWGEREHYLTIYFITYIEVILHSFAATICLGWKFGFAQYIIAIVPVGFYICYTLDIKRKKFTIATVSAIFSAAAFLACKFLSFFGEPLVEVDNIVLELSFYVFNSLCAFVFLILFSLVFVFEMKLSSNQLKHQNAILNKLASTDPLTGLYNRRSMDIFLNQAVESASSFALIMCDIDNFKKVNDTYGHDFGDVVLKGIAGITSDQVKGHGYVCRWGGEEILILINNASEESSLRIAENIRRNVANRVFELNNKWIHCSLTLGVALYDGKESVEDTITRADYNLYCGKRNGKNAVVL
ncbi:MAG: GGDEF domain-containing protein [Lachnospiraceae bacterium]|nr:GGDEF domain-containing protein [Lachnospiraceae bacterium]